MTLLSFLLLLLLLPSIIGGGNNMMSSLLLVTAKTTLPTTTSKTKSNNIRSSPPSFPIVAAEQKQEQEEPLSSDSDATTTVAVVASNTAASSASTSSVSEEDTTTTTTTTTVDKEPEEESDQTTSYESLLFGQKTNNKPNDNINNNKNRHNNNDFQKQEQQRMSMMMLDRTLSTLDILQQQQQQQQQQARRRRILQSPAEICETYNNPITPNVTAIASEEETANGGTTNTGPRMPLLDCTCKRFHDVETEVKCSYRNVQCNEDDTVCYNGKFELILNSALESRVITTCTAFLDENDNDENNRGGGETCIRVFPVVNGRYRRLDSCSVTYTPDPSGKNAKVCQGCSVCGINAVTNTSEITIDCCNLETDLIQTCGPVASQSGVSVPFWDEIPIDEQGQCVSKSAAVTAKSSVTFVMMLALSSSSLLLIVNWL